MCPIVTVKSVNSSSKDKLRVELDSHADTTVVGSNVLIVHDHERFVDVYGYDNKSRHKNITTVDAAVAYDDPQTGNVSLLLINQAILIPSMENILLCPMQCRLNNVTVNDVPKFLVKNATVNDHLIIIPSDDDAMHALHIPLKLQGVTSYFPVRAATLAEYESEEIPKFHLTAEAPDWDPGSTSFSSQENSMLDFRGRIVSTVITTRGRITMQVNAIASAPFAAYCVVDATDDNNFGSYLESFIRISLTSTSRKAAIGHDELAKRWGIHPDRAKATVQRTTQRGVRNIANPALVRRFRTNDRMLRYRRLRHPVFTDTMFADTYSRRNNKCAQVFATDFGWVRVYPMKTKGEAHETLSLLFQREGVPPSIVMDGSKEQTLGKFRHKLVDASCQMKQTEPYSPWQNAAEREIKELKKGSGRKMLTSGAPR